MKIHEYQAKALLEKFGVNVPRGIPCQTVDEAVQAATRLGGPVWVVKAQIHAGGRGKGGGVKLARSLDEVRQHASQILGMQLVTHQTGPGGQQVRRLLVEEGADISREYYLAVLTDRATQKIVMMASSEGGMDIEALAHSSPEKILRTYIDPLIGLDDQQAATLAAGIGIPPASVPQAVVLFKGLYACYMESDASLAEINPLILEGNGTLKALDAKFNFDDNALYRHPDILACRDLDEEDANEIAASKFDLAYISLDGNIGCLVNGAGLAMATMDTIKLFGGEPANFLDVGGGASTEKVTAAFRIMLGNRQVRGILVNIFGGIMKCDTIANGIITAARETRLDVPLVVRMNGTNEALGRQLLRDSGLPIISADSMADAARQIVVAVR
ncbi:MAG: ADP-forming succinate--CoA ligase subunit beta [Propionivibrio sp.]|nr:ADP-forming succinate--CoA ligase subunit beta [Propionivibrio sp.]